MKRLLAFFSILQNVGGVQFNLQRNRLGAHKLLNFKFSLNMMNTDSISTTLKESNDDIKIENKVSKEINSIYIRRANVKDASNLTIFGARRFTETFGHLYPPEETIAYNKKEYNDKVFLDFIDDEKQGVWVAYSRSNKDDITSENDENLENDVLAGYCIVGPCSLPNTTILNGEIKKMYVDIPYFGTILSARLFETGVKWLRINYKDSPIYIGVYSENYRAIAFYNKYKFEKVDEYIYEVGKNRDREFILCETDNTAGSPRVQISNK